MDNCDDVIDDLLGLPGFIRRNLLLMRELDLRFISYLNDAKKKEHALMSSFPDTSTDASCGIDKGDSNSVTVTTPTRRLSSEGNKGLSSAKGRASKSKSGSDSKQKGDGNDPKRPCRSGSWGSAPTGGSNSAGAASPSSEHMEEIQKLRMDAMSLVQEKLAINDQITCMLKHEYENLKVAFDSMYREMEMTGQMTEKLRMSFTVNKSKHQLLIDSVLSQTELDLLDDGSGAFITEVDGGSSSRSVPTMSSQVYSAVGSNKDSSLKHRGSNMVKSS